MGTKVFVDNFPAGTTVDEVRAEWEKLGAPILVGLVLVPVASQVSVDYLDTREFAMRPRQWLNLMTQTKATISFGPPFGYELCTRRLRPGEATKYDLSNWRVAGVGAEMIRSETLTRFAQALKPAGFNENAFLACYGMAECSLAISFAPLFQGHSTDCVDGDYHSDFQEALPIHLSENPGRARCFVDCGTPLPEATVEACRAADAVLLGAAGLPHVRWPDGTSSEHVLDAGSGPTTVTR